jgi:hypothetical protein
MPEITTLIYAPYYKPIDTKAFKTRVVSMVDLFNFPIPTFNTVNIDYGGFGIMFGSGYNVFAVDKLTVDVSPPTVNKNVIESSTAEIRGV